LIRYRRLRRARRREAKIGKRMFKQTPENIVLASALGKGAADAVAQVEQTH
jgi:hypothetical protein